ncbi:unnamed protein product, partial [Rotaria magnacalcarata]
MDKNSYDWSKTQRWIVKNGIQAYFILCKARKRIEISSKNDFDQFNKNIYSLCDDSYQCILWFLFCYDACRSIHFFKSKNLFSLVLFCHGLFSFDDHQDLFNIKIVVTGDDLTNDKKRSLIILNHRTRLDWMFVWMLHSRYKILKQLKIVLKAELKRVPFLGWSIQHAGYLFLERIWTKDQQKMKSVISYYKSCQTPLSLLIFPEGTNLNDETRIKSNNYASKQTNYNRPYDYCLHPHTTGFTYLLNTMRSDDMIDNIDDVTIGYEGDFPITEFDLLKGVFPSVVHFHVKRYSINDLPQEDEKIGEWLQNCWDEKENRLKKFYMTKQFDPLSNTFKNRKKESNVRFQRRLAMILWTLFVLF